MITSVLHMVLYKKANTKDMGSIRRADQNPLHIPRRTVILPPGLCITQTECYI